MGDDHVAVTSHRDAHTMNHRIDGGVSDLLVYSPQVGAGVERVILEDLLVVHAHYPTIVGTDDVDGGSVEDRCQRVEVVRHDRGVAGVLAGPVVPSVCRFEAADLVGSPGVFTDPVQVGSDKHRPEMPILVERHLGVGNRGEGHSTSPVPMFIQMWLGATAFHSRMVFQLTAESPGPCGCTGVTM